MTDEQRLQAITELLLLVRDNLFHGMSKSMQKLQARSINEMLALPSYVSNGGPDYKAALMVWLDKTEWVQETGRTSELGMHRADVLRQRIEKLEAAVKLIATAEDSALDLAYCKGVARAALEGK